MLELQIFRAQRIVAALIVLAACQAAPVLTPPSPAAQTPATPRPTAEPPVPTSTPAPPSATAPTAAAASPEPTPTGAEAAPTQIPATGRPEPIIHTFEAAVDLADPGETITVTWRWSGARGATIYPLLPTGQFTDRGWVAAPAGSLPYTIPAERRNQETLALLVYDDDSGVTRATLTIRLRCPDEWFFAPAPDICPAGPPVFGDGAEQPFEGGTMLWNRAEGLIYVLFDHTDSRSWQTARDEWREGDPATDPDLHPPPGLYQPVRGFGLLWRRYPTIRERLGWAVAPEQGYRTAVQSTSHFRYRQKYIRALDGGVWYLGPNGSDWEYIPAPED